VEGTGSTLLTYSCGSICPICLNNEAVILQLLEEDVDGAQSHQESYNNEGIPVVWVHGEGTRLHQIGIRNLNFVGGLIEGYIVIPEEGGAQSDVVG
jgi:hypothetical protein